MSYTGPRGTNPDRDANRGGRTVREPGSGGNGRNGTSGERTVREPGSGLGDGARRIGGGSSGSRGGSDGNIFKDFGHNIGRNPLGAISTFLQDGVNEPIRDLHRSQGQVWQAAGRSAQQEGRYYRQAGYRDGAKAAYGDDLYAGVEYGRVSKQASRYGMTTSQQGYGQGAPSGYAQPFPAPYAGGQGNAPQFQGYSQAPGSYGYAPQGGQGAYSQAPGVNTPPAPQTTPSAPAPVVAAPAPAPASTPAAAAPTAGAPAPTSTPAPTPTSTAAATSMDDAQGGRTTQTYRYKGKAPKSDEMPVIAKNQVEILQKALIEAGFHVGPTGADGMYGPNTHFALLEFGKTLNPPVIDLSKLDFVGKNEASKDFLRDLGAAIQAKKGIAAPAPTPEVKAPAPEVKPAGPTPEQLAAQRYEQSIPPAVRGTNFDPRNIAQLSQQQRYDLARNALHGLDELKSERSTPNLERMHDKMDETVRWANKHLGLNLPRPTEANPLSDEAMYALGLRAAYEGKLSNARGDIIELPQGMTQAAMDRAAVQYLKALDRGVSREDPSRAIRNFEKKDMGRAGIEVDGLADPEMLEALRQAVAVRNGLVSVRAEGVAFAPSAQTQTQATALPTSVTGGAETTGPDGAAASAPTGQTAGTPQVER